MHSEFSIDSKDTPESLVAKGAERGLKAMALTEHESIASLPRAKAEAARWGIEYVHGVEIGTTIEVEGHTLVSHILAYFFNENAPGISRICETVHKKDQEVTKAALKGFKNLGIPLTLEELEELYPGRVSTWSLRRQLRVAEIAKDKPEAEDLVKKALAAASYRPETPPLDLSVRGILNAMKKDGATTFLAHPFWLTFESRGGYSEEMIWKQIEMSRQLGIDGLEVFNTSNDAGYSSQVLAYCKEHQIPASGGSDSHGKGGVGRCEANEEILLSIKRFRNGEAKVWD